MRNDLCLRPWSVSCTGSGWAEDFYESIFFIGNGRLGIRGYVSCEPDSRPVQKGMYVAGIFGEIKPGITDFVNLPTPVRDRIYIDGVEAELASEIRRVLDLRTATLTMTYSLRQGDKLLEVEYQRFLPREHPALIMQRLVLTPHADMELSLSSGIQVSSCNSPIPDDQTKSNGETVQLSHLVSSSVVEEGIQCTFEIQGTSLTVTQEVQFHCPDFSFICGMGTEAMYLATAKAHEKLVFDKAASVLTSRDVDPRIAPLSKSWNYDALWQEHKAGWEAVWKQCDVSLPCMDGVDEQMQTGLRFSMYTLMGSCSAKDPTVSIGARGLTHGRYKGCYFWDTDMFMLPFFLKNDLEAARNLCEYRVRSLQAAKAHSKKMNTAGARYPWMAALDGTEQCETWDIGCSEVHITADVVYALDAYCQASGDEAFYLDKVAEVYVETARFWVSRYTFRTEIGKADLLFCKGPDEYCGITNNNLFTNVMVQHNLSLALQAAMDLREKRPDIYARLGITEAETQHMEALRKGIPWPHDPVTGHLTQDDTWHLLEPVDIRTIKADEGASYHTVCFDRLQRYKVIKQADVLLLMTRLPQLFSPEEKQQAWEDFEPYCLHDSTLSFASHALFALQNGLIDPGLAYLKKALLLDLRDVMGNTGHEGLHLACMGEAWQAALSLLSCAEGHASNQENT